ncbi:PREDICTED: tigger transposable element-derived protein 1-like [Dufourea novaeangliae]|uniref:tigger transposable element-derived protein 1-like n=1 Tax=Dufourea novaeangliae TaxID=178035 RepID=UPI000767048E|nr:PREDICTED: tigger transposable element-derived protein 1-like [Dufourea novaeangliae]
MGPKKKMMSIELKREIIEKHEQGVRVIDLARISHTLPQTRNRKTRLKPVGAGLTTLESSSDVKAAEVYIKTFSELIEAKGYIPQQVFNCDETGLFWKRMPNRTYITAEEKTMPGHKPMKDRLTLALCANASGDCKIKPLLVYHSENPRAFKSHKILKEKLQVMWRANPKAWVTRKFFVEWINLVFGPSVKKYLQENNLPMQALLVLDNVPAHPPNLEDDLLEEFKFINVLYLPPNTTPILQPMDQQVAWLGVTTRTLTSAWKKLWPEAVAERAFEGLESEVSVVEEIVSLGKSMGLEVDKRDVNELVEEQSQELTTEELHDLHSQQHTVVQRKMSFEEEPEMEEVISTRDIKEILGMWEKVVEFVDKNHPEKVATGRASELFNETCLTHFCNILKGRKKQTSLDSFFKRSAGENEQSVTKKAKNSDEN